MSHIYVIVTETENIAPYFVSYHGNSPVEQRMVYESLLYNSQILNCIKAESYRA